MCTYVKVADLVKQPEWRGYLSKLEAASVEKIGEVVKTRFAEGLSRDQWTPKTLEGLNVPADVALWFYFDQLSKATNSGEIVLVNAKFSKIKDLIDQRRLTDAKTIAFFRQVCQPLIAEKQTFVEQQKPKPMTRPSVSAQIVKADSEKPASVAKEKSSGWGRICRVVAGGAVGYAVDRVQGAVFGAVAALNNKAAIGGGIGYYLTGGLPGGILCAIIASHADSIGKSIESGLSLGLSMGLMGMGNSYALEIIEQLLGSYVLGATLVNMYGNNLVQGLRSLINFSKDKNTSQEFKIAGVAFSAIGIIASANVLYQRFIKASMTVG